MPNGFSGVFINSGENSLFFFILSYNLSGSWACISQPESPLIPDPTPVGVMQSGGWVCLPPAIPEPQEAGFQMGEQTSEAAPPRQSTESKHKETKAPGLRVLSFKSGSQGLSMPTHVL